MPAGFNGVVGYKPTRGLISFEGITPACSSLDCIAFTARTVSDARTLWHICEDYDPNDRYARDTFPSERHVNSLGVQRQAFRFGIPPPEVLELCSPMFRKFFNEAVNRLQGIGGMLVPIDWTPFQKAGDLLYEGTFVSERLVRILMCNQAAVHHGRRVSHKLRHSTCPLTGTFRSNPDFESLRHLLILTLLQASLPDDFLDKNRQHLHPVILELFEKVVARRSTAVQLFRELQAKALYTRQATSQFASASELGIDVLVRNLTGKRVSQTSCGYDVSPKTRHAVCVWVETALSFHLRFLRHC